jgi:hypothetical protein
MPRFDQRCTQCAWADEIIAAPYEQPSCPHCGGTTERVWRSSAAVASDDIPGGVVIDNLVPGRKFYSKSEIRREMRAQNVEPFERHTPVPGSDKSPHTTAWVAVNLDAGKALAERQATTRVRESRDMRTPDQRVRETVTRVYEELEAQ